MYTIFYLFSFFQKISFLSLKISQFCPFKFRNNFCPPHPLLERKITANALLLNALTKRRIGYRGVDKKY